MICPNCKRQIPDGSVFCGYCGREIPQVPLCGHCGAELRPDDRFCGVCGAPVEVPSDTNAADLAALEQHLAQRREEMASLRRELEEQTEALKSDRETLEAERAEQTRLAEEKRKAEEARLAEEKRKAEEVRLAEEKRKAEEARLAEEKRKAEEARLAEEKRKAEEVRLAEEKRKAEEARLAEEKRKVEEAARASEAAKAAKAAKVETKTKKKQGGALVGILIALLIMALLAVAIYLSGGHHEQYWENLYKWPDTNVRHNDVLEDNIESEKVAAFSPTVGDTVTFGRYEQDNDTSNGPEPIQWKVLDVQGDKALLLSQDVLVRLQYHPQESGATWKDCTLRQWLNDDFYHAAFSEEELERVCLTRNVNEDNPTYGTDGGEDTDDYVFLLSLSEAENYFASDEERQCEFSAAVNMIVDQDPSVQKGIFETEDPYGYDRRWWLRTPGMYPLTTVILEKDGSVSHNGNTGAYASGVACHQWNGVRPAIWIEID